MFFLLDTALLIDNAFAHVVQKLSEQRVWLGVRVFKAKFVSCDVDNKTEKC